MYDVSQAGLDSHGKLQAYHKLEPSDLLHPCEKERDFKSFQRWSSGNPL